MYNDDENANDKTVENLEKYHSYFFSYLSEYQQITIDNLLEKRDISVIDLFNKTNEELIVLNGEIFINSIIKEEFQRKRSSLIQGGNSLIDKFDNLKENEVLNYIIKKIQSVVKNSDNILRDILKKYSIQDEKDYDFFTFFLQGIEKLISDNSKKIINELIKNGYLVYYLFEKEIPSKFKKVISSFIENINISRLDYDNNNDETVLNLKIPGSQILFKNIKNLIEECKIDYLNIEDEYRKPAKKKVDNNETKKNWKIFITKRNNF